MVLLVVALRGQGYSTIQWRLGHCDNLHIPHWENMPRCYLGPCVPSDCYNPPLIYCTHTSPMHTVLHTCPILYAHLPHTVRTHPPYCTHTSPILYAHLPHTVCTPPPYCMHTSPRLFAHALLRLYLTMPITTASGENLFSSHVSKNLSSINNVTREVE